MITAQHVLTADWQALYDEIAAFRDACGDAHLKVILATAELLRFGTSSEPVSLR